MSFTRLLPWWIDMGQRIHPIEHLIHMIAGSLVPVVILDLQPYKGFKHPFTYGPRQAFDAVKSVHSI